MIGPEQGSKPDVSCGRVGEVDGGRLTGRIGNRQRYAVLVLRIIIVWAAIKQMLEILVELQVVVHRKLGRYAAVPVRSAPGGVRAEVFWTGLGRTVLGWDTGVKTWNCNLDTIGSALLGAVLAPCWTRLAVCETVGP